uniref:hypothetical protein n=1 Tax=Microseira wollei TaxID=467598 RepID=UPI001CFD3530|nr:hypothetical protein [Microseira wollei]
MNFLRGTISSRVNHYWIPFTAFYRWEQSQPNALYVDSGINVAINPKRFKIIPILADIAISEDKLVTVCE